MGQADDRIPSHGTAELATPFADITSVSWEQSTAKVTCESGLITGTLLEYLFFIVAYHMIKAAATSLPNVMLLIWLVTG